MGWMTYFGQVEGCYGMDDAVNIKHALRVLIVDYATTCSKLTLLFFECGNVMGGSAYWTSGS